MLLPIRIVLLLRLLYLRAIAQLQQGLLEELIVERQEARLVTHCRRALALVSPEGFRKDRHPLSASRNNSRRLGRRRANLSSQKLLGRYFRISALIRVLCASVRTANLG